MNYVHCTNTKIEIRPDYLPEDVVCRYSLPNVVLCIGSNLGLKFGRERPIRVLLPHLAEPKIYK